ncbi:uncharacterized protein KIAA0408-like isoform X3 [Megalops cyprinoides]|uniref:uncharacterized protein KIAA0408-like isoform X3 n=1 Tax=Megalops cyprinoides TaxID=118141 RepID=UPI001864A17B|nr:uncharacterized protein KIAA0408-like isoform X3 [Megalops cyprinoides]XP_036405781.1 uncharacterized protein KIAA0408-like isoform X3 [Megalops cyprinoides]XP_036405782.1 uncharacterized protein KIAA0408-like isoform X3 [Megalops cyprinoides]
MAATDLQCRLEHGERSWGQEEAALLERFDAERKEWESQLRDMQKNIEELYNEVKARREGNTAGLDSRTQDGSLRLGTQSDSTVPSLPADSPNHHSNGYFEPAPQYNNGYSDPPHQHSNGYDASNHLGNRSSVRPDHCSNGGYDTIGYLSNGHSHHSNGYSHPADCHSYGKRDSVETELEDILHNCLGQGPEYISSSAGQHTSFRPLNGCQNVDYSQLYPTNGPRKSTTAVNSALKEIARVSEDLCSYQDVIRKKSGDKRSGGESLCFEEMENVKNKESHSGSQWCDNFRVLSEQDNQMNWENMSRIPTKMDAGARPSSRNKEAPPIPPRTTSWYMNGSTAPEPQLPFQESFTDRKCTSPSVLRKFGAMLQENEGKTLTDSGVVINLVPADSKCNIGSYHGKLGSSKSPTHVPVQKCLSDVGTLADMDYSQDCRPTDSPKVPRGQFQPEDREFVGKSVHMDFRGSPFSVSSPCSDPRGQWRNQTVAQKGFEEEGLMGVSSRPKSVNSYPSVQYVENRVGGRPVGSAWDSGLQVLNENASRSTPPAVHTQPNCRVEETALRGYESCNGSQQYQKCRLYGSGREDDLIELLGMLGIEHQSDSRQRPPQTPCHQATPQESQESVKKGFSRPARPANRRPPSRWANRVPSSPATHVTRPSDPAPKQFICPYSYHIETVIM